MCALAFSERFLLNFIANTIRNMHAINYFMFSLSLSLYTILAMNCPRSGAAHSAAVPLKRSANQFCRNAILIKLYSEYQL